MLGGFGEYVLLLPATLPWVIIPLLSSAQGSRLGARPEVPTHTAAFWSMGESEVTLVISTVGT